MPRSREMSPVEKIDAKIEELQKEKEIVLKYFGNGHGRRGPVSASQVNTGGATVNTGGKRVDTLKTMAELVKEKKRPLSIAEFEEGLKAKGWASSNKDPKKTIWAAITRGKFKKSKPGYYTTRA